MEYENKNYDGRLCERMKCLGVGVAACGLILALTPGYAQAYPDAFQNGTGMVPYSQGQDNGFSSMQGQQNTLGQPGTQSGQFFGQQPSGQMGNQPAFGRQPGQGQQGQQTVSTASSPTEVVAGTVTNSAAELESDYANATRITMSDSNSQVKIETSGTYIISGSCSNGNIVVKKGTNGVVLVLEDLDLTSTTGAAVSVNKESEAKIIISGNVTLTDGENPDDENSSDADVADAYDGAALKAKANSKVYLTGNGTLTVNGAAKNGIKAGDEASLVIDGATINITAANDGINANYDLALLSGNLTINAGDDAVHADRILTIGSENSNPTIKVTSSVEALEGTVINIYGGDITLAASDDAINAANADATFENELTYSFNMMGGTISINCTGDGIDSNGNVNLINGSATIKSGAAGGEAGIDFIGSLYISDQFQLNNSSGIALPDGDMSGQMGEAQMPGNQQNGTTSNQQQTEQPPQQQTSGQEGQLTPPEQNGQLNDQGMSNVEQAPSQNTMQPAGVYQMDKPFDDGHFLGRIGNWFVQLPQRAPWMPDWMGNACRGFGNWIGGFSR